MTNNFATLRTRIQAQGFCGLDDATYRQINYPLRISPAICMVWAAIGTAMASPLVLWTLVPEVPVDDREDKYVKGCRPTL